MPANSCRAFDMSGRALSGFRALSNTVNLVPIKFDLDTRGYVIRSYDPIFPLLLHLNALYLNFPTKFSPPLDKSVASMEIR